MKKITLALGGGGMKGFAHIGVIRQLRKKAIRSPLYQEPVSADWLVPYMLPGFQHRNWKRSQRV